MVIFHGYVIKLPEGTWKPTSAAVAMFAATKMPEDTQTYPISLEASQNKREHIEKSRI